MKCLCLEQSKHMLGTWQNSTNNVSEKNNYINTIFLPTYVIFMIEKFFYIAEQLQSCIDKIVYKYQF